MIITLTLSKILLIWLITIWTLETIVLIFKLEFAKRLRAVNKGQKLMIWLLLLIRFSQKGDITMIILFSITLALTIAFTIKYLAKNEF